LKTAGSISPKDAEDFARTKHDGLPEKKKKKKMLVVLKIKKTTKIKNLSM
jgi:hypothetical protein